MTTTDPVVRVRDLRKDYGSLTALDGVSFDIHRGETFALLGPNGAGKSTAIEILEGYRDRSGGEVSVLGTDPQHGGIEWRSRLGIVLQSGGEARQVRPFADPDCVLADLLDRAGVQHPLTDPHPDPGRRVVGGEDAVGQVGDAEGVVVGQFEPGAGGGQFRLLGRGRAW